MRNKVLLLRSNDLNPDPRAEKYISYFRQNAIPYWLLGWNRTGKEIERENISYYNKTAQFGSGTKNITNLIGWNWFLLKELFKQRKSIRIIHACDFDTVLPALLIKALFGIPVIFDVFDWYSASHRMDNKIIKWIVSTLEHIAVRNSTHIIICEPERIVQLGDVEESKVMVMQNIPDFPENITFNNILVNSNYRLKIGYVGILSEDRGLEHLLMVVSKCKDVELTIAGFGKLESLILNYAEQYPNIHYEGKVDYVVGLKILAASDCIYAMYSKCIPNHILAAPNKFYESLFLARPIITTNGTLVGNKVIQYDSGFVIEEGIEPLLNLIGHVSCEQCKEKGANAAKYWQLIYRHRIADFFEKEYQPIIEKTY